MAMRQFSQPFRRQSHYESNVWPELSIVYDEERIVAECGGKPLHSLSSAVYGGGFQSVKRIINWKVPLHYDCSDPIGDFRAMLADCGYEPDSAVGFLTAAKLTHAAFREESGDRFAIVCMSTAGIGNAARSGVARPSFAAYKPGTINTFVLIDGDMTPSAMVNAVITATEAKSAALQDLDVTDTLNGLPATGTTTDAVTVAVSQSGRYGVRHDYAGTATTIGNAIGRLVYDTVYGAVITRDEL
ncbi:adenosylcobinamide amidohydrolase [Paenibacillus sp. GCM10027626]|uniref:adenosylcobinamide amidohydrolase n=1 Tax=Paenibacillus sp. GCM10027626 TaxID=3273411 RepID=UPI0036349CCE